LPSRLLAKLAKIRPDLTGRPLLGVNPLRLAGFPNHVWDTYFSLRVFDPARIEIVPMGKRGIEPSYGNDIQTSSSQPCYVKGETEGVASQSKAQPMTVGEASSPVRLCTNPLFRANATPAGLPTKSLP
jgi:hypothetical protein